MMENSRVDNIVYDVNGNPTAERIRVFPTAADCTAETNVILTLNVTMTYSAGRLTSRKVLIV